MRELRGLRGTEPSGGLEVDASGHFFPSRDALLFFQYFLSASNEATPEELAARMQLAIDERLDPPADREAKTFLDRYLAYLEAGDAEFREPGLSDSAALERRLQWARELRREHFGPELADRLFGEEEAALKVHMERRRVARESASDPEAARKRLEALEASYPEAIREARAHASLPLRHAAEERALREAGAAPEEIDALRERRFGPEAADRMRALDEERADWEARLAAYRILRGGILRGERLATLDTPEARQSALTRLRAEHFSPEEQRRVEILDRQDGELSEQ